MTKREFDDFIVLHDTFEDKCALVASIFGEVVEDFRNVNDWGIDPPFTTCTGYREPGCVYSISPTPRFLCVPFKYIQMTEDELRDIAKNHPEQIKAMVNTDAEQENEEAEELNDPDIDDLVIVDSYDWEPVEWVLSIPCPHCKKYNDIYRSEIPNKEFTIKCYFCDKSFRIQVG